MSLKFSIIATLFICLSFSRSLTAIGEKELWKGSARLYIGNLTADQVWPFLEDYCNIYIVFPVTVSFCVGGVPNQPGYRRYLASVVPPTNGNSTETTVRWEEQSLVEINTSKRLIRFEFVANNENVEMFESTMQVVKRKQGCILTWNYEVTATLGYTNEALLAELNGRLQFAAGKMKHSLTN